MNFDYVLLSVSELDEVLHLVAQASDYDSDMTPEDVCSELEDCLCQWKRDAPRMTGNPDDFDRITLTSGPNRMAVLLDGEEVFSYEGEDVLKFWAGVRILGITNRGILREDFVRINWRSGGGIVNAKRPLRFTPVANQEIC